MAPVVVTPYDPAWPERFEEIAAKLRPALGDRITGIEHVGSTSVPGLAAKPVVDIDVVISSEESFPEVKAGLESLGYSHQGDLGIPGREYFKEPEGAVRQNLYVCVEGALPLKNHRLLRDRLKADTRVRDAYGELKTKLAEAHPDSVDAYCEAKTDFIVKILSDEGIDGSNLEDIRKSNTGRS